MPSRMLWPLSMFGIVACAWVCANVASRAAEPCRIDVVDDESGWPVPLVELETTHGVRFVSDNAGIVAFDLPELFGEPTWLAIEGHGYEAPVDGFGYRGVRVTPLPGERLEIRVRRTLPARRVGRLTGAGLFGEAQRFGLHADWRESRILGCDSVQTALYQGKRYWFWGDTTLARYPLGLFHMTGAVTAPRPLAKLAPPLQVGFDYFCDAEGRPRVVAELSGSGPTWLSGLTVVPDASGRERLCAHYAKITPPLTPHETGLCVWNDANQQFERLSTLWRQTDESPQPPPGPTGHAVRWTDDNDVDWLVFGDGLPHLQCAPTWEAWQDPAGWRTFAPQQEVPAREGGKPIAVHRASMGFSPARQRWVAVFTEYFGKASAFGEIWYAEADNPLGPWAGAIRVASHNRYTFYNPRLHLDLGQTDPGALLFEGTFVNTFSATQSKTPRYDYNQVLYRLELSELGLPLANGAQE